MLPEYRNPPGNLPEECALARALRVAAARAGRLSEVYRQRWPDDETGLLFNSEGILFSLLSALSCLEAFLMGGTDDAHKHVVDYPDPPQPEPDPQAHNYPTTSRFSNLN